jgi:hypothetical protein
MVRARHGAPLVKGNSHGIEINAIGHVRASDVTRSAPFEWREGVNRLSTHTKIEKAWTENDRKLWTNRMDIGKPK